MVAFFKGTVAPQGRNRISTMSTTIHKIQPRYSVEAESIAPHLRIKSDLDWMAVQSRGIRRLAMMKPPCLRPVAEVSYIDVVLHTDRVSGPFDTGWFSSRPAQ